MVDYEEYGAMKTYPLISGGEDIAVTNVNRHEYLQSYVRWLLEDSIDQQFSAFSEGREFLSQHHRCTCTDLLSIEVHAHWPERSRSLIN